MAGNVPQRSCLGCREARDKGELLRFVVAPDRTLVPDLLGKLPGRGAYTCLREACLRAAVAKRQFARSFRGEVHVGDADSLVAQLATLMRARIASYVALANKGGKVVSGSDVVTELFRKRSPGILFLATDISAENRAKFMHMAEKSGTPCVALFDRDRLGELLGKEQRTVVAVEQGGFSETILREFDKYRNFFEGGVQSR
ncbi:MAG TPA: DUF448 domain-containing protein [Geobacteraceae bacterium]